jgi:hypothetical protein
LEESVDIIEFRHEVASRDFVIPEYVVSDEMVDEISPVSRPDTVGAPEFKIVTAEELHIDIIQERTYFRDPRPEDLLKRIRQDGLDVLYLSEILEFIDSGIRPERGFCQTVVHNGDDGLEVFWIDFRVQLPGSDGKGAISLFFGIPTTIIAPDWPTIVARRAPAVPSS